MAHPFRDHPVRTALAGVTAGLVIGLTGTAVAAGGGPTTTTPSPSPGAPSATAPGKHLRARGELGTVQSDTPTSVTITDPGGAAKTIGLNSSTVYRRDGAAASVSDLAPGEHVVIRLVDPSATSPVAQTVQIIDPALAGVVTSVSGNTVLITDFEGFQRKIITSSATTYANGKTPATASAVTTGSRIIAFGSIDPDKTDLDARHIVVVPAGAGARAGKFGGFGPGGFGGGPGGFGGGPGGFGGGPGGFGGRRAGLPNGHGGAPEAPVSPTSPPTTAG